MLQFSLYMKALYFISNNVIGPSSAQGMLHFNSHVFLHDTGGSRLYSAATSLRMRPGQEGVFSGALPTSELQGLL